MGIVFVRLRTWAKLPVASCTVVRTLSFKSRRNQFRVTARLYIFHCEVFPLKDHFPKDRGANCIGIGVVCTSPGSGGVVKGVTGSGGGTFGLVAMAILSLPERVGRTKNSHAHSPPNISGKSQLATVAAAAMLANTAQKKTK